MENSLYREIIRKYIAAYNRFDIETMLSDMDPGIKFEFISKGKTVLTISGLNDLKLQAEKSRQFFKERRQTIKSFNFKGNQVEIEIDYMAVSASDIPGGLKAGGKMEVKGKSVFTFKDNKIIELKDISLE
jgi:ketosteroid isomerase-like protein